MSVTKILNEVFLSSKPYDAFIKRGNIVRKVLLVSGSIITFLGVFSLVYSGAAHLGFIGNCVSFSSAQALIIGTLLTEAGLLILIFGVKKEVLAHKNRKMIKAGMRIGIDLWRAHKEHQIKDQELSSIRTAEIASGSSNMSQVKAALAKGQK